METEKKKAHKFLNFLLFIIILSLGLVFYSKYVGVKGLIVKEYRVDIVVMGSDWAGSDKFDYLKEYCEVVYLDRTEGISTTKIKKDLGLQEPINGINQIPNC